jgi:hypothetical protein
MSVDAPVRGHLLARVVTEALAPAILIAAQLVAVGWHAGQQAGSSRWWGLPAALFAAVIPFGYILRGVRRGRFADHHIPERERRLLPLLVGVVSVVVGLALLIMLGAPRDLIALLTAGAVGLTVFGAVTVWWKMSIHCGVAGGTVVILTAVYGPAALITAPLVPLVGWARVRLAAHTVAQAVAGAGVGVLIAALVFPPLR